MNRDRQDGTGTRFTLHHFWLSPFCRKVRLVLAEKGLAVDLKLERYWQREERFLALNPAGEVPVLVDAEGPTIADSQAIVEYLEECFGEPALLGDDALRRAEVRRLTAWFDQKFYREVSDYLLREKLLKRFMRMGEPRSDALRAGRANIDSHLAYIGYLIERRTWLAGDRFSLADIAAGAHLSCLDYLGDVPWQKHQGAKDWYARLKSRPSFRPILNDHLPGLPAPAHYADLDF